MFFGSTDSKEFRGKNKAGKNPRAEVPHLDGRAKEVWRRETPGVGKGDWMDCDKSPSRLNVNM